MNYPWLIKNQRILVIGDVHQDLRWLTTVMEIEKNNFDHILLNGDMAHYHKKHEGIAGMRQSGKMYKWILDNHYVNLGNHELSIMESWHKNSKYKNHHNPKHLITGYTKSSTLKFNKEIPSWNDWMKTSVFRVVNGWLVSHAGFTSDYWFMDRHDTYNLERLWALSEDDKIGLVTGMSSGLFRVGSSRMNVETIIPLKGGPLWLDWDEEFDGSIPLQQIVGHTPGNIAVRTKFNSYNIDGNQSTYAIIQPNGTIYIKYIYFTKKNEIFTGRLL